MLTVCFDSGSNQGGSSEEGYSSMVQRPNNTYMFWQGLKAQWVRAVQLLCLPPESWICGCMSLGGQVVRVLCSRQRVPGLCSATLHLAQQAKHKPESAALGYSTLKPQG